MKIYLIKGKYMIKKLAPLVVLALFAIGVYFMMQGMSNAIDMTKNKKEINK